jgi:two-component system, NarL family, response regulator NreC
MKLITLFVIGNETISRLALKHFLSTDVGLHVTGEAASDDAIQRAGKLKPDVVIVFAEATRPGCAVVVGALRRKVPEAGIVILGRETHQAYLGMLLTAGALGYVLLSASPRDLFNAIRAAALGRRFIDPNLSGELFELLARQAESGTKLLSHREQQVLSMLAYGHTLKEIALLLNISRKSIETYKARIREKLGLRTRADVVRYALETGMLNAEAEHTETAGSGNWGTLAKGAYVPGHPSPQ